MKRANQIIEVDFSKSRNRTESTLAVANGCVENMSGEFASRECAEIEDFEAEARRARAKYAASQRKIEAVQPLKDEQNIQKVINYLKTTGKYALRNWLLFIIGISTGLRCSDIVVLTFGHFFESNGMLKDVIVFNEKKTGKKKVYNINDQLREALTAYVKTLPTGYELDSYIFYSNKKSSAHLKVDTVRRVIVNAVEEAINKDIRAYNEQIEEETKHLGCAVDNDELIECNEINGNEANGDRGAAYPKRKKPLVHVGSHTMRKTYALRALKAAEANKELNPFSPAPLTVVQGLLNHSSELMTLRYLGLDVEARRTVEHKMFCGLAF